MPLVTRWSFQGAKDIAAELNKLDAAVRKDISAKAMEAATSVLVNPMRAAAPKRTGVLARSVSKAVRVYESKTFGIVGPQKEGWYGRLIEFGTKDRSTKGKGYYKVSANRGRIRPNTFISSTGEAHSAKATSTLISVLTSEISKRVGG